MAVYPKVCSVVKKFSLAENFLIRAFYVCYLPPQAVISSSNRDFFCRGQGFASDQFPLKQGGQGFSPGKTTLVYVFVGLIDWK